MITYPQLEQFKKDLSQFCSENLKIEDLVTEFKTDKSPVTSIDIAISNFCKNHSACNEHFYSEEDHQELQFPAIILDPIDGTKELIKKNGECSVSIAWMSSPSTGKALVFNPFTGFCITSYDTSPWLPTRAEKPYLGFVSRSEYENTDLFKNSPFQIAPRGSIAYKLGLLSAGACDFVVSLKPKSIWDIAAGTIMAWQRGMHFFSAGQLITQLNAKTYAPPLVWCKSQISKEINSCFSFHEDKDQ